MHTKIYGENGVVQTAAKTRHPSYVTIRNFFVLKFNGTLIKEDGKRKQSKG